MFFNYFFNIDVINKIYKFKKYFNIFINNKK